MARALSVALLWIVWPPCARADIAVPPAPLFGSPGPRTAVVDGRRTPLPLVRPPRAESPPVLRDAAAVKRSEAVELVFLRNVVWVRARVVVRAAGAPLRAWAMGLADHADRTAGLPLYFLSVHVDGQPASTYERSIPTAEAGGGPAYDGWIEWRLDLRPDRDTVVELSYVRPSRWRCVDAPGETAECPGGALEQRLPYRRLQAERFRDGRGDLALSARAAGFDARVSWTEGEDDGALRSVDPDAPTAIGAEVAGPLTIVARAPRLEGRPPDSVPSWLTMLDDNLEARAFAPTASRPIAPGWDAEGFERRVEALRAAAAEDDPMRSQVAAGLLEALRQRLSWEAEWIGDEEPTGLPPRDAVGRLGGRLDTPGWREALEEAMAWTTPPGAPSLALPEGPIVDPAPESRSESASAADRAELVRLLDERFQRPTSSGARRLDPRTDAREIGREIGPPFGRPNQLVLASRGRSPSWPFALALVALAAAAAAGAWALRRRLRG